MTKLLAERGDKRLADLGLLVVGLEVVTLLVAGVTADRRDVDHAVAELDEGATLDGDIEVSKVVQAEVGKLLPLVLADPLDEAAGGELLAELVRRQAVLREAVVEEGDDGDTSRLAQLLLLLYQVGAADEADSALLTECGEKGEHLGRSGLYCEETRVVSRQ